MENGHLKQQLSCEEEQEQGLGGSEAKHRGGVGHTSPQ